MNIARFEEEWESLTKRYEHGSFTYDGSSPARRIIASAFSKVQRQNKYGVYVFRQRDTREVLYIGRSGTIEGGGNFKGQDLPERLANVKGKISADKWFSSLANEKGQLVIEYVFLDLKPESPALVESCLLQAYLNERGCLPYRNNEL